MQKEPEIWGMVYIKRNTLSPSLYKLDPLILCYSSNSELHLWKGYTFSNDSRTETISWSWKKSGADETNGKYFIPC